LLLTGTQKAGMMDLNVDVNEKFEEGITRAKL
jgi:hypothetical protein